MLPRRTSGPRSPAFAEIDASGPPQAGKFRVLLSTRPRNTALNRPERRVHDAEAK
jgi:hypothetical protein